MSSIDGILEKFRSRDPVARLDLIRDAYGFAREFHGDQKRVDGTPLIDHLLAVADTLSDYNMDEITVAAGVLHAVLEHSDVDEDDLRNRLDPDVMELLESLRRISKVTYKAKREDQAEFFRRLMLAMAQDVRVVMVKLADHLENMRTFSSSDRGECATAARETLDIFAPLANRLGINRMKSELEDIGFRLDHREIYEELVLKAEKRLTERGPFVEEVKTILKDLLKEAGLTGTVSGRPKHFLSVYKKMLAQKIDFDKVYDLIAFRIIVDTVSDCYTVLGSIHGRWKPVPGRFKDYVALPKSNLYQSLHTTVIGPGGQPMEIQIRTHEMHRIAEEGFAAHWRYKENRSGPTREDQVFHWLRQLLDSSKEIGDAGEFLESVKGELFPDVVYVFTPGGDLMELPKGATPVDFAFSVHSQVGAKCVGAKVNDRMVPLNHQLKNGDRVEIVTQKNQTPSADWLEFVKSSKARNRIRQWIRTEQRERSIQLGKEVCEREFRKVGKSFSKAWKEGLLDDIASRFGFNKPEEVVESVGFGKTSARLVLERVYPEFEAKEDEEPKKQRKPKTARKGIVISGVGDAMVRFARCCNPLPGEPVIGFVTRGHGLAVHTSDCVNASKLDPQRIVDVEWGGEDDGAHPVRIRISCKDGSGILAQVTNALAQFEANVVRADIKTWTIGQAECNFEILVKSLDVLERIMGALQGLKGVHNVERIKK